MTKIAIVTDIHAGLDNDYIQGSLALGLLDEALAELATHEPDLLAELGDRTNDDSLEIRLNNLSELSKRFSALSIPRHHLLGNHDFLPVSEQERLLATTLHNHSVVAGGWQLVFLYTFVSGTVTGGVSEEDLGWLEQTLAENTLPKIIFSHQPLDGVPTQGNLLFDAVPHYLTPNNAEKVRAILEKSNVVLSVNGHTHWNRLERINGISYLHLNAVTPLLQNTNKTTAYSLLTLDGKGVSVNVFGRDPAEFYIEAP
jgi:3',5'-cyclic-AMP phosphodiesterase